MLTGSSSWNFPGFEVHNVASDGNCLFLALAHQLHITGVDSVCQPPAIIRSKIVDFIEEDNELSNQVSQGMDRGLNHHFYLRFSNSIDSLE